MIEKGLEDPNYLPEQTEIGGTDEFSDGGVRFKFKRLADRLPGESWINLIYGQSKSGKTFTAGTTGPRSLYINTGEGIETLMAPAFRERYPEAARGIIMVDIREQKPDGTADAFDMITDVIDHGLKYFPDKFDWIVLDDATFTRKAALLKGMELNTAARTKTTRKNRMTDYVKADVGDYGEEMAMIEWLLSQYIPIFRGAQKHFTLLAHERQIFARPANIGDEPVLKRIVPGFTGKTFPDKVPSFFDDVMHSEWITDASGNCEYRLRTMGNDMEMGGTRHGGIFASVEKNPNLKEMLERIKKAQRYTTPSLRRR